VFLIDDNRVTRFPWLSCESVSALASSACFSLERQSPSSHFAERYGSRRCTSEADDNRGEDWTTEPALLHKLPIPGMKSDPVSYEDHVRHGEVGSFLFLTDPKEINRPQKIAMTEQRLHIPILFGFDVIHGFDTEFPVPLAVAASWDPAMAERGRRSLPRRRAMRACAGVLRRCRTSHETHGGAASLSWHCNGTRSGTRFSRNA
jgi:Glycosyl hydrolase family 3 N terminal domain